MLRELHFYTDGAFSAKSEMGGWACICLEDDCILQEFKGYEPYSTNNRMELTAVKAALEAASMVETGHTSIKIYTDSAYIANAFNQGWYTNWIKNGWKTADKQDVKNQDLWRPIVALYIKIKGRFQLEIIKVKGHSGNKWNTYADAIAQKMRKILEEN